MRLIMAYALADDPDKVEEITVGPASIIASERQFKLGIDKILSEGRLEPIAFMVHDALVRQAGKEGGSVNPFKTWLENDLVDIEASGALNIDPKSGVTRRNASEDK